MHTSHVIVFGGLWRLGIHLVRGVIWLRPFLCGQESPPTVMTRAGVLVLGTRTRNTRVLNFLYSYCTRTREFQSNSTHACTRTRGQVLRYSYEYWHEYWYSKVHLMICDVRVKTGGLPYLWNKQFDLPWRKWSKLIYFVIMITSFNFIIIEKSTELLLWCLGLLL